MGSRWHVITIIPPKAQCMDAACDAQQNTNCVVLAWPSHTSFPQVTLPRLQDGSGVEAVKDQLAFGHLVTSWHS